MRQRGAQRPAGKRDLEIVVAVAARVFERSGAGGIEGGETERGEEIAFLTVSLAGEKAAYVTGQCLLANGGKYFL